MKLKYFDNAALRVLYCHPISHVRRESHTEKATKAETGLLERLFCPPIFLNIFLCSRNLWLLHALRKANSVDLKGLSLSLSGLAMLPLFSGLHPVAGITRAMLNAFRCVSTEMGKAKET